MRTASFRDLSAKAALTLLQAGLARDAADNARTARARTSAATGGSGAAPAMTVEISEDAKAIDRIKDMAKSDLFRTAAAGRTDDRIRTMVRDGQIPKLPVLSDAQRANLTPAEVNVYGVVSGLQGMYDAMPKTLDEALRDHVDVVLESYPDMIAREKAAVADGSAKEEGWPALIAAHEAELAAAREGRMTIKEVRDPALVRGVHDFTISGDGAGFSGRAEKTESDMPVLQKALNAKNVQVGSSPYLAFGYAIIW